MTVSASMINVQLRTMAQGNLEPAGKQKQSTPSVVVVIPTYNSPDTVIRAITSVLEQDYNISKLIVVDDCSEKQLSIRDLASCDFQIIRNSSNLGLSRSLNQLLESIKEYDYMLLVQDDVQLMSTNYLSSSVNLLETSGAAIATGRAIIPDNLPWYEKSYAKLLYLHYTSGEPEVISYSTLKADLIRISSLLKIGGFGYAGNEKLGVEDQVLGARLRKIGEKIIFNPAVAYQISFARVNGLAGLMRKECIYGWTLGNAFIEKAINVHLKDRLSRSRLRNRQAQVVSILLIPVSLLMGLLIGRPFLALLPLIALYSWYLLRFSSLPIKERVTTAFIGILSSVSFASSFLAGIITRQFLHSLHKLRTSGTRGTE